MLRWRILTANKRDGGSYAVHYLTPSRNDLGKLLTPFTSIMAMMAIIPTDDVDEEFQRCRDLVEQFVNDLEQAASGDST